jgi:hypothetical protein
MNPRLKTTARVHASRLEGRTPLAQRTKATQGVSMMWMPARLVKEVIELITSRPRDTRNPLRSLGIPSRKPLQSLVVALLALVVTREASHLNAEVIPIAYYRLGENDPSAANGQAGRPQTADSVGSAALSRSLVGAASYSSGVAASAFAQTDSTLSMSLSNGACYIRPELLSAVTDNFGIEGWFRPRSFPNSAVALAYNGHSGESGFGLFMFSGQLCGMYGGERVLPSHHFAASNTWTYFAMVRSGGQTSLYVNSAEPIDGGSYAPRPATTGFSIGSNNDGGETFDGDIDEVRVFSFAPGQFSSSDLLIAVPEPATYSLALTGVACGGCLIRRRRTLR